MRMKPISQAHLKACIRNGALRCAKEDSSSANSDFKSFIDLDPSVCSPSFTQDLIPFSVPVKPVKPAIFLAREIVEL